MKQRDLSDSTVSIPFLSQNMSSVLLRILFALFLLSIIFPQKSDGQYEQEQEQWCIADEQTPDDVLQATMDWACGEGGADCSNIQENQSCYLPNTVKDHASYAFNSYFQKHNHTAGSCYFNGAGVTTELDPSHGSCHYEFIASSNLG